MATINSEVATGLRMYGRDGFMRSAARPSGRWRPTGRRTGACWRRTATAAVAAILPMVVLAAITATTAAGAAAFATAAAAAAAATAATAATAASAAAGPR